MNADWIIHYIPCPPQPSFHTHGLDRHNSLELELNLALVPKQAMQFINLIAMNMVETGKRYQSGDREDDVFNLPFYLFQTTPIQSSRPDDQVLRILFCDSGNRYPWEEGCQPPYSGQLNADEAAAIPGYINVPDDVLYEPVSAELSMKKSRCGVYDPRNLDLIADWCRKLGYHYKFI